MVCDSLFTDLTIILYSLNMSKAKT